MDATERCVCEPGCGEEDGAGGGAGPDGRHRGHQRPAGGRPRHCRHGQARGPPHRLLPQAAGPRCRLTDRSEPVNY